MKKKYIACAMALALSLSFCSCKNASESENFVKGKLDDMPVMNFGDETGLWLTETDRVIFGDVIYLDKDFITISVQGKEFSFLQTDNTRDFIKHIRKKGHTLDVGSEVGITFDIDEESGVMTATELELTVEEKDSEPQSSENTEGENQTQSGEAKE